MELNAPITARPHHQLVCKSPEKKSPSVSVMSSPNVSRVVTAKQRCSVSSPRLVGYSKQQSKQKPAQKHLKLPPTQPTPVLMQTTVKPPPFTQQQIIINTSKTDYPLIDQVALSLNWKVVKD